MAQMKKNSHQKKIAQVVAPINMPAYSTNPTTSTSSMALDPMFISRKAFPADSANTIFGRRFGITYKTSD